MMGWDEDVGGCGAGTLRRGCIVDCSVEGSGRLVIESTAVHSPNEFTKLR